MQPYSGSDTEAAGASFSVGVQMYSGSVTETAGASFSVGVQMYSGSVTEATGAAMAVLLIDPSICTAKINVMSAHAAAVAI